MVAKVFSWCGSRLGGSAPMTARRTPPWRGDSVAGAPPGLATTTTPIRQATTTAAVTTARKRETALDISYLPRRATWMATRRPTRRCGWADATKGRYTCQPVLPVKSAFASRSVLGEPDVLELLVRVVVGRGHVVLHLGPVHHVARPPEPGHVVRVLQDELLQLGDQLLALAGIERARLAGEEIVDGGIGEPPPVLRVPGGVAAKEHVRVVRGLHGGKDDQLEAARVPSVGEPGRRLQGPVLGLDADLPPLLDRIDGQVLI